MQYMFPGPTELSITNCICSAIFAQVTPQYVLYSVH